MEKRIETQDSVLFSELQTMRPYASAAFVTELEKLCMRVSHWFTLAGIIGFVIVLGIAAIRYITGPLPPWLKTTGLVIGVLDILAIYGMLLSEAVATFLQVANNKIRNHHEQANFGHDLQLASLIRAYPEVTIARADAWIEQQGTGMERRVSALFGKELAMVTVLTTLLTGKANEVWESVTSFLAPAFHTSQLSVTGALLAALLLLVIGAFRVKARVARLAYLRYLIRLANLGESLSDIESASPEPVPALNPATPVLIRQNAMESGKAQAPLPEGFPVVTA